MRSRHKRLQREIDADQPDTSRIVHTFPNGWTIRQLQTLADERREGILMRHCLHQAGEPLYALEGVYSLRDPTNRPHVTIDHRTDRRPAVSIAFGGANSHPKPRYRALIEDWHRTLPYAAEYSSGATNVEYEREMQIIEDVDAFFAGQPHR